MAIIALAGDTMLGRSIGERHFASAAVPVVGPDVIERLAETDGLILNLECSLSEVGTPNRRRLLRFRGLPALADLLLKLHVKAVTLSNNHALDFGPDALLETLRILADAGIGSVGAGVNIADARRPLRVRVADMDLRLIGFTDHPRNFGARPNRPGVAFADVRRTIPDWIRELVCDGKDEFTMVLPHWGPNFRLRPRRYILRAARDLQQAGASLVAGHSAHAFHGVSRTTLYNLGDFVDDFPRVPLLRNDLGLLWLLDYTPRADRLRLKALPLSIRRGQTRLADKATLPLIHTRLQRACRPLNTKVTLGPDGFDFFFDGE